MIGGCYCLKESDLPSMYLARHALDRIAVILPLVIRTSMLLLLIAKLLLGWNNSIC